MFILVGQLCDRRGLAGGDAELSGPSPLRPHECSRGVRPTSYPRPPRVLPLLLSIFPHVFLHVVTRVALCSPTVLLAQPAPDYPTPDSQYTEQKRQRQFTADRRRIYPYRQWRREAGVQSWHRDLHGPRRPDQRERCPGRGR